MLRRSPENLAVSSTNTGRGAVSRLILSTSTYLSG